MSELTDAMRRFADEIDQGRPVSADHACIVLADSSGGVNATYFGRGVPAQMAGISLLAAGIERFVAGVKPTVPLSLVRGSTN